MAPPNPMFTPTNGKCLGPQEFDADLDGYVNPDANVFEECHSNLDHANSSSFFDNAFCSYDDSSITLEDIFGARIVHRTETDIDWEDSRPDCHVDEDPNLDGPESSNTNPTHPVELFGPPAPVGSTINPGIFSSSRSAGNEVNITHGATEKVLLQGESTTADSKAMQDQIEADFDKEMLQDAMAILKLQNLIVSIKQGQACLQDIYTMMDRWEAQELADSLSALEDQSTVDGIYKLYQLLLSLIKDYLVKATSDFLPRAYRGLPMVDSGLTSNEHQRLEGRVGLDILDTPGRKLLFWAFLRHELMSKVRLYVAVIDRNYRPRAELSRRGGHKFRPWEDEAIRCVHTYIQTLYTAFFSEWSGAEMPHPPPPGLGHSSSIVCDTTQWVEALTNDKSVCATAAARLPNYGHQPIMSLLDERQKKKQGQEASIEPALSLLRDARSSCDYGRAHNDTISGNFDRKRGSVPGLWMEIVLHHGTPRNYTQEGLTLLRQRAWVFFWDATAQPQYEGLLSISLKAGTGLLLKGWERSFFQEGATSVGRFEGDGQRSCLGSISRYLSRYPGTPYGSR